MNKAHSIIIVGDLFPVPSNYSKFSEGDVSYLFGKKICELFSQADYRICNLEGALTDNPGKCEKLGVSLYAPTTTVNAYKQLHIDYCNLANNHITDAGSNGVIDTIRTLDKAGITYLGAGKNEDAICKYVFFKVGETTICLYNVAETIFNAPSKTQPGAHLYDEYVVCKELEELRKECDYLIVVYHGGAERYRYPTPQTKKRFHRMADSGADMVLSQHTHCVGTEEYYNGAYLLYGQGNFLFRSFNNEFTNTGLILELVFDNGCTRVKKHLVNAGKDTVRYYADQDFTAFYERSEKIKDDAFVQEQFRKHAYSRIDNYLNAYKGKKTILNRFFHRFLPEYYKKRLFSSYNRSELLKTLHSLRSEQNREMAMEGLLALLDTDQFKNQKK